jgi:hypothetical protein
VGWHNENERQKAQDTVRKQILTIQPFQHADRPMKRIKKAVAKNAPLAMRRSPTRAKYPALQEEDASAPKPSAAEILRLARLARKYGIEIVIATEPRLVKKYGPAILIAAVEKAPLRGPGRPSRGLLPYYERMNLTEWIEEQAEEHRQNGSTKPYTDAEIDVFEMLGGNEKSRDLQKFRKTIKKSRQQGRQDLIELLQAMIRTRRYGKRQDLIGLLQHYQMHARPVSRGRK